MTIFYVSLHYPLLPVLPAGLTAVALSNLLPIIRFSVTGVICWNLISKSVNADC